MVLLQENSPAPPFSAAATNGKIVSLADFLGKKNVVLYFYPEDDTPGCTIEACAFRDDIEKFAAAGAAVLGVSADDVASHKKFTEKFKLNFPLLADSGGAICSAYGVEMKGHWAKRVTFIIGKDGVVKKVFSSVNVRAHSREVLDALAAIA